MILGEKSALEDIVVVGVGLISDELIMHALIAVAADKK